MAYEKKGHKLRGRQSLGRYQLLISNKNNHSKELLDQHVRQPAGDHSLALQCLRQEYGGESEEAPAVKKRRTVSLSPFEEHAIFLAYTCLRLGLTEKNFSYHVPDCLFFGCADFRSPLAFSILQRGYHSGCHEPLGATRGQGEGQRCAFHLCR